MVLAHMLQREVEIKAPAEKFYEICHTKTQHIANITPEKVQAVKMHEGDWGFAGSIIAWHYTIDGKEHIAKEIVEVIDDENKLVSYKVIEGDLLNEYKSFKVIVQSVPKGQGGLIKWTMEYEKLSDDIPPPEKLMEFCLHATKDIEEHLINA